MSLSDLDRHKVDHLFLLVGENPLPNYVAAQLLLKGQKIAYLVFSTHTDKVAERLKEALKKLHIQVKDVPLRNSESNGCLIARSLQDVASKISSKETIGLHYTGGTKVMAAHAYRALLNLNQNRSLAVFSYLDSRTLQLCIDDLENQQTRIFPAVLENPPSLETILGLHNLKWKAGKEPQKQPRAKEAAIAFAKFHTKADYGKAWRDWCRNTLYALKQSNSGNSRWQAENNLEAQHKLKIDKLPSSIVQVLRHYLEASVTELDLNLIKQKYSFPTLELVCQWLDGVWLEECVLSQIQGIDSQFVLSQPVMSIHIQDPKRSRQTDQFEFDVAFLHNYQLFGISCTTSLDHARCKQKLFEAILRVRQLGGDEARIALASANSDREQVKWLKQEVSLAISDRKIEVFGHDDLDTEKFSRKLINWVQQKTI